MRFPARNDPSVSGSDSRPPSRLIALANDLEAHLEPLGFPRESRPFQPHVTIARVKGRPPHELADVFDLYGEETFGTVSRPTTASCINQNCDRRVRSTRCCPHRRWDADAPPFIVTLGPTLLVAKVINARHADEIGWRLISFPRAETGDDERRLLHLRSMLRKAYYRYKGRGIGDVRSTDMRTADARCLWGVDPEDIESSSRSRASAQ